MRENTVSMQAKADGNCARSKANGHSWIVFEDHRGERKVMAVDDLDRIECLSVSQVEMAGGQKFVQYRGGLLELEDPADLLSGNDKKQFVLIRKRAHNRQIGLVVRSVVDIADGEIVRDQQKDNPRLALVDSRLATVMERVAADGDALQEVA